MIRPSAFRLSPADRPGSCRRTRRPTASYTTTGDTIHLEDHRRVSKAHLVAFRNLPQIADQDLMAEIEELRTSVRTCSSYV